MLASVGYQIDHRMPARPKHKGIRVPSNANSRPAKSQPVDAQELTERLFVVLAEQKARSQGKPCVTAGAERLAKTKAVSRPKASVVHASSIAVTSTSTSTSTSMSTTSRRDVPLSHDTEKPAPRAELSREDEAKTSSIKRRGKTNGNNARVDGEPDCCSFYRHVPQVAASQFTTTTTTTTTTVEASTAIHKVPRQAIKFHTDNSNANQATRATKFQGSPCDQAKAIRRARSMHERQHERNRLLERALPITPELEACLHFLPHHHNLKTHTWQAKGRDGAGKTARRMSTGSIIGPPQPPSLNPLDIADSFPPLEKREVTGEVYRRRVDWTQSDEATPTQNKTTSFVVVSTASSSKHSELRKRESKWTLKGRLGGFGRYGRDDKIPSPPEERVLHDSSSSKCAKSNFFLVKCASDA